MIPSRTCIPILGTYGWSSGEALAKGIKEELRATEGELHLGLSNAYAFKPIDVIKEVLSDDEFRSQAHRIHLHVSVALELPFDREASPREMWKRLQVLPKEVHVDDLRFHGLYKKVTVKQSAEYKAQKVEVSSGEEHWEKEGESLSVKVVGASRKELQPLDWKKHIPEMVDLWDENPGLKIGSCNISVLDAIKFEAEVKTEYVNKKRQRPESDLVYAYEVDACPYSDMLDFRQFVQAEPTKRMGLGFRALGSDEARKPNDREGISVEQKFRLAGIGYSAVYYRSENPEHRAQAREWIMADRGDFDLRPLLALRKEGWTCSFFQHMEYKQPPKDLHW